MIKTVATIAALIVLSGCSTTVPVKAKFPELPERLQVKCLDSGEGERRSKAK